MSNQPRQIIKVYFTGAQESMGFIPGRQYRLVMRPANFMERLRYGRQAVIMQSPQYCPYASSQAFWANWSYTDPSAKRPAAPGTLYKPQRVTLPRFNKELLRSLGFDDWREFAIDFGGWAETKDFTYQASLYDPSEGANFGILINAYLQERLAQ